MYNIGDRYELKVRFKKKERFGRFYVYEFKDPLYGTVFKWETRLYKVYDRFGEEDDLIIRATIEGKVKEGVYMIKRVELLDRIKG